MLCSVAAVGLLALSNAFAAPCTSPSWDGTALLSDAVDFRISWSTSGDSITVELSAQTVCPGATVRGVNQVAANLQPALDDVDFGSASGLQHQQQGSSLSVAVRANAQSSGRLVAYQVEMYFDPSVLTQDRISCSI